MLKFNEKEEQNNKQVVSRERVKIKLKEARYVLGHIIGNVKMIWSEKYNKFTLHFKSNIRYGNVMHTHSKKKSVTFGKWWSGVGLKKLKRFFTSEYNFLYILLLAQKGIIQ